MGLKKIELHLYFKDDKNLMADLYHVHHLVSLGKMKAIQENFTFDVLYAQEIPYEIQTINGKQCMVFQSKMNNET